MSVSFIKNVCVLSKCHLYQSNQNKMICLAKKDKMNVTLKNYPKSHFVIIHIKIHFENGYLNAYNLHVKSIKALFVLL